MTHRTEKDELVTRKVERQLNDVSLELSVSFQEVSITSSELLDLAVGDVLPLNHPVSQPLAVLTDGVRVGAAVPGSHGHHLACQIVSL